MDELGVPDGRSTAKALANWLTDLLKRMLDGEEGSKHRARLENLYQHGFTMLSDYSGKQCPELSLRMLSRALQHLGVEVLEDALEDWRATEISPLCLKVISEGQKPPRHCFTGLLERLPHQHQTELKKLWPLGHPKKNKAAKASVQERKVAYLAMDKYLKRHASSCYSWNATSTCCILRPVEHCEVGSDGSLESGSKPPNRRQHRTAKQIEEKCFRRLTRAVAGAMCTPWLSFGAMECLADPATEPWFVWFNEQLQLLRISSPSRTHPCSHVMTFLAGTWRARTTSSRSCLGPRTTTALIVL